MAVNCDMVSDMQSDNVRIRRGRRASRDNNLLNNYPEVAAQWHPTKNGDKKPEDFTPGSGKKAWWECGRGHEWEATINNRTKGNGCPYCSGRKA